MNEYVLENGKAGGRKPFTKGEELFNAVSHIGGGALGIAALILGVVFAAVYNDWVAVASMAVFGSTMIVLYSMSAIYHFLRAKRAKKVFKVLDHCGIYLLIAGTYTPFCLIVMRGVTSAYLVLGFVWAVSALGVTLNAVNMYNKTVKIFSYVSYIALGWCVMMIAGTLVSSLSVSPASFWLLLAGGIAYTVGFVFYALSGRIKYIHAVWHLFVIAGTATHFLAMLLFLVS
jgi:hemolysin III